MKGAFFRVDAHLERFFASCRSFRLDPGKWIANEEQRRFGLNVIVSKVQRIPARSVAVAKVDGQPIGADVPGR